MTGKWRVLKNIPRGCRRNRPTRELWKTWLDGWLLRGIPCWLLRGIPWFVSEGKMWMRVGVFFVFRLSFTSIAHADVVTLTLVLALHVARTLANANDFCPVESIPCLPRISPESMLCIVLKIARCCCWNCSRSFAPLSSPLSMASSIETLFCKKCVHICVCTYSLVWCLILWCVSRDLRVCRHACYKYITLAGEKTDVPETYGELSLIIILLWWLSAGAFGS